jgi:hypothetical protein
MAIPPNVLSAALGAGTCLIGGMLAYQYSGLEAVQPEQAKTLFYAFGLAALFAVASILFSKAQANKEAK